MMQNTSFEEFSGISKIRPPLLGAVGTASAAAKSCKILMEKLLIREVLPTATIQRFYY
jgi:hypothetical protein